MTASSSACTPLFLKEAPQSTGTMEPATVAFRMARWISSYDSSCTGQVLLEQLVVVLDRRLDQLVPRRLDPLAVRLGHRHLGERLAERLVVEDDLDPPEHVDVPGEHLARADREAGADRPSW